MLKTALKILFGLGLGMAGLVTFLYLGLLMINGGPT